MKYCYVILLLLFSFSLHTICYAVTFSYKGVVIDAATGDPLSFATISLSGDKSYSVLSDEHGFFSIAAVVEDVYRLQVTYVGYNQLRRELSIHEDISATLKLTQSSNALAEVVVTAHESQGIVSSSKINREMMTHLQPTSFTDLLELLPGNISQTPQMGQVNSIHLRETGTLGASGTPVSNSDYSISSLGTLFVVDGAPLNTDANLQNIPGTTDASSPEYARDATNKGVDMRTISTDDIESVEIVRGIPSAEYGNLTSGLVNIKRIRRATPLTARFKADEYSKLFSVGKGFSFDRYNMLLNVDAGFLDSKADPRNHLENYKRATFSLRITRDWIGEKWRLTWSPSADYTGSFDNSKIDPEINYGNTDEYKSTYQRLAVAIGVQVVPKNVPHLSRVDASVSVSQQFDRLERERLVSPQRAGIAPASTEPGEYDAYLLFGEYMAEYSVDGKPFNAYAKLSADLDFRTDWLKNTVKVGTEWSLSKNFGRGQEYDLSRPLLASGWNTRPRAYYSIPAMQTLAVYVQDNATVRAGNHTLEVRAGVRATTLPGLSDAYDMYRQWYADPRLNMQWNLPAFGKRQFRLSFSGGIGWPTRQPTLN